MPAALVKRVDGEKADPHAEVRSLAGHGCFASPSVPAFATARAEPVDAARCHDAIVSPVSVAAAGNFCHRRPLHLYAGECWRWSDGGPWRLCLSRTPALDTVEGAASAAATWGRVT